jgi:acetyl-CoA carboxylase alpha subunit
MKKAILSSLDSLLAMPVDKLREERYSKFRGMGKFIEG